MERKVIERKIKPPTLDEAVISFSRAKSSLVFGSQPTNKIPESCMKVVSNVRFTIPLRYPFSKAALPTSQMFSNCVEMAALMVKALLFTVVNMA